MRIETLEVKNYRLLRDTAFDNLWALVVVVGAHGSGKSTLFDVFRFVQTSLTGNVAAAVAQRGGFRELVSREVKGPIEIVVRFRDKSGRPASCCLEIAAGNGDAIVHSETLEGFRDTSEMRALVSAWRFIEAVPPGDSAASPARSTRILDALRPSADGTRPFLALEAPELGLDPTAIRRLAGGLRAYAQGGGQLFLSTYSPDFLDGFTLDEIFRLERRDGFTRVKKLSEIALLGRLTAEGDRPGDLWRQGLFEESAAGRGGGR